MPEALVPAMPPQVPRKANRLARAVGLFLLKTMDWRIVGCFPAEQKVICAVGPHTSNWDFVVGMAAVMACDIDVRYIMKKEAFIWPFSKLFVWLGGEPLDRNATDDTIEQIVKHYLDADQLWVGITPEGTRKKVKYWKKGFLRIAEQAGIPVLLVGFDYPNKHIVVDKLWSTTGDHSADAAAIQAYMCQRFRGRHPSQQ